MPAGTVSAPPIYLDNQSTTPLDVRVLDAMRPYFEELFGNPHSRDHVFGWRAYEAVAVARPHIATLINADDREIILTSGATESCNMALFGVADTSTQVAKNSTGESASKRNKIVTVATEHSCVLEICTALSARGFEVVVLPVGADGLVSLERVAAVVDDKTLIVSVMLANNEIGVIQPLAEIAALCQQAGAYLHSDATQGVGKIDVDVDVLGVDFMSFSAHKLYGPKGIGALYVRHAARGAMRPLIYGGGQEQGLRGGTLPVPLVVGFGEACRIAALEMEHDIAHTGALARQLYDGLAARVHNMQLLGHATQRLPGNLSLAFRQKSGEAILAAVGNRLALSTGSACNSTTASESHVLAALKLKNGLAYNAIRASVGRFNTLSEIEATIGMLADVVNK